MHKSTPRRAKASPKLASPTTKALKSPQSTRKRPIVTKTPKKALKSSLAPHKSTNYAIVPLKPAHSNVFRNTTPAKGMSMDPLNQFPDQEVHRADHTYISTRTAGEAIRVLLVGYHSHVGQHLYTHLTAYGFNVYPVGREAVSHRNWTTVLPIYLLEEKGLPDVDFVINCQGLNHWNPETPRKLLYESRVGTNKFWADRIRETSAKPYAFITLSSAFQYPGDTGETFDESFNLPALSTYLNERHECDQFDEQLGLSFTQRMFRDSETHSRVFIPELDSRTPEQIEELRRAKMQYDLKHLKVGYGDVEAQHDPQKYRDQSARHQLLTNDQVRVVNLRHGLLMSKTMQEMKYVNSHLLNGEFRSTIEGNAVVPAMHIDDFCQSVIHCMVNHDIYGAVNAVTPEPVHSTDVLQYVARLNRAWIKSGQNSRNDIRALFGDEEATRLLGNRLVAPNVLQKTGFKWRYPNIQAMRESGPSIFEQEIEQVGFENLDRNAEWSIFH